MPKRRPFDEMTPRQREAYIAYGFKPGSFAGSVPYSDMMIARARAMTQGLRNIEDLTPRKEDEDNTTN